MSSFSGPTPTLTALSFRDRALLGAVAAGRCDIEPDPLPYLTIEGRGACDQLAAYQLLACGLIEAGPVEVSGRTPARLTEAGRAALEASRPQA